MHQDRLKVIEMSVSTICRAWVNRFASLFFHYRKNRSSVRFFLPSPWGIVEIYPPTVMKWFLGERLWFLMRRVKKIWEDYCFSVSEILQKKPVAPELHFFSNWNSIYNKMEAKSKDFNSTIGSKEAQEHGWLLENACGLGCMRKLEVGKRRTVTKWKRSTRHDGKCDMSKCTKEYALREIDRLICGFKLRKFQVGG